ncbi:MAG: Glutaminyl-tRNA synthetase [Candidatus Fermentimicrarchaeum limneticum]|uniref:Glutamate--tRNA ligase n=1 Tax=Fermentimicrarchaeum limneticum TaxID=2795018 RepID=A0A7D5XJ25_FERL1|nr:MAG: Glutaminyl-tRNA synthetase [Candidatus Fermentimicrarchaeum limneticum]
MKIEEIAYKHALRNASEYGKAQAGAVVGKVIAEMPEAKSDMKNTMKVISEVIAKVNKMSKEKIGKELSKFTFEEKKEEVRRIMLEDGERGKVVTRFLPEPNGFMHLGHAKAAFLSYEAAKEYVGKCILRFDDTNPKKESQQFVDAIKQDLEWLGMKFEREVYSSDKMPDFYKLATQLVKQGDAYVCSCEKEKVNELRGLGKSCGCRSASIEDNLDAWEEMLAGKYKKGDAILRLKAEPDAANTVMRDPTLFRICNAEHYRQGKKYSVWPTYDFEVSIADSLDGVTHALRSKEYELRDELYYRIIEKLGMRKPIVYDFSRLTLKGFPLSKRLLKPLVEEKKVSGWDDPRMPTIKALRRRGILSEAIKNFVLSFGLSKVESEPSVDALLTENRKLLDPKAPRYFFVKDPIELIVDGMEKGEVKVRKHPTENLGERVMEITGKFFISKSDAEKLKKGDRFRLLDLCNVKLVEKGKILKAEFTGNEGMEERKLQWVPEKHLKAEVLVPSELFIGDKFNKSSLKVDEGYCEPECGNLKKGDVVQFVRYGFCVLDDEKKMRFILTNP